MKIAVVSLDVSAQLSARRQDVRETTATQSSLTIPQRASVGLTLGVELFF